MTSTPRLPSPNNGPVVGRTESETAMGKGICYPSNTPANQNKYVLY